jgi:Ca2+-binding EF-hand superfamily protein
MKTHDVRRWFMPLILPWTCLCADAGPIRAQGKAETQSARQQVGQSRDFGASLPSANALKAILYSRCTEGGQRLWDVLSNAPMRRSFEQGESRYGWAWLAARFDADQDGEVTRREFTGSDEQFRRLDRNRDGVVTAADFDWSDRSPLLVTAQTASQQLNLLDKDSNGRISAEEWSETFSRIAKNKDYLTQDDLQQFLTPSSRAAQSASSNSGLQLQRLKAFLRGESVHLFREAPHVCVPAPDFLLWTKDKNEQVRLSQFRGKRPVVLVFGSFTCPPYRVQATVLDDMHRRYGDRVQFLAIYLREAHPTDGWRSEANDRVGLTIKQPVDMAGRQAAARSFCSALDLRMPVLLDELDDRVGRAYNAKPNRLILVDREGDVAYRSAAGPFGFNPPDLEQSLIMLLLDEAQAAPSRVQRVVPSQSIFKRDSSSNHTAQSVTGCRGIELSHCP